MGSYPRREKAEQKARERADAVPALDCQSCGALTPGERFRYFADLIVCEACGEQNPQSRRRLVSRTLSIPEIFW
jgi:formylmethanofuran dehydrogenase subunit E